MNTITKIASFITFFLLFVLVVVYFWMRGEVCGERKLFDDEMLAVKVTYYCWGGAAGGVDTKVDILFNGESKELFKTYASKGKVCIKKRSINKYFFTTNIPASKFYSFKKHLRFKKSELQIDYNNSIRYSQCKDVFDK